MVAIRWIYSDLKTAIPQAVADGMARGLSPEQATGHFDHL